MNVILDHLTAIVVGTVLLGGLLVLQQRHQQSAVEAAQRYRAQALASELTTTLEREVENIRSRAETERAFEIVGGRAIEPGAPTYRFRILRDATDSYTEELSFPTASAPDGLGSSGVAIVTYRVEPTGETVRIDGADRPLYTATRYEFVRGGAVRTTAAYERIVDFDVTGLAGLQPDDQVRDAPVVDPVPPRMRLEIEFAPELVTARAADQAAPEATSIRYARSLRVPAAPGRRAFDTTSPGGIRAFPAD